MYGEGGCPSRVVGADPVAPSESGAGTYEVVGVPLALSGPLPPVMPAARSASF